MGFNEALTIKPTKAQVPSTYRLNGSMCGRKGISKNKLQTGWAFYE
jgi:hypothetical protein